MVSSEDANGWVSCTSLRWMYALDPATFETRRAIANLVRAHDGARGDEAPEIEDVLPYARAAKQVAKAANEILHTVVAEALTRGATLDQVGRQLNISRSAVSNRFKRDPPDELRVNLELEDFYSSYVVISAYERGADSLLPVPGPDEHSIYLYKGALTRLAGAAGIIEDAARMMPEDLRQTDIVPDRIALKDAHDRIKDSLKVLLQSQIVEWLARQPSPEAFWRTCDDHQPAIYMWYGLFQAQIVGWFLRRSLEFIESGHINSHLVAFWRAFQHNTYMLDALNRPECQVFWSAAIRRNERTDDGNPGNVGDNNSNDE